MRTNVDKKKRVILKSKITGQLEEFSSRTEMQKELHVNANTLYKFLRGDEGSILRRYFELIIK